MSGLLEMLARLTRGGGPLSTQGLLVNGTTTCLYVCPGLTFARALALEALQHSLRAPCMVLLSESARTMESAEIARMEEDATNRTIEHLAAAGIRTLRLSELIVGGESHG